jgi:Metallo-beta-lactamase superfamily
MNRVQKPLLQIPAENEIDVVVVGPGFGESILIHIGDGDWIIVDSCLDSSSDRPAALVFFEHIGVDPKRAVKLICASHWHDDHVGGIADLIQACGSAEFACSAALNRSEFVELASIYNQNRTLIQPSGPSEMYNVLSLLEQKRKPPLRVVAGLPFFRRTHGDVRLSCVVTALSPSNVEFDRFLRAIANVYPALRTSKSLRVPDLQPNDLSIAMWVEVGNLNILLGADVEEHDDPKRGWSAIVAVRGGNPRASLFKIAHHGSITGHYPGIWTDLLTKRPHAVLTPWNRGSKLPTEADCTRITSLTDLAFATSRPTPRRQKRKEAAVDRTLDEANISIRDIEPPTGFVHLRAEASSLNWTFTLSAEAITLDKFAS